MFKKTYSWQNFLVLSAMMLCVETANGSKRGPAATTASGKRVRAVEIEQKATQLDQDREFAPPPPRTDRSDSLTDQTPLPLSRSGSLTSPTDFPPLSRPASSSTNPFGGSVSTRKISITADPDSSRDSSSAPSSSAPTSSLSSSPSSSSSSDPIPSSSPSASSSSSSSSPSAPTPSSISSSSSSSSSSSHGPSSSSSSSSSSSAPVIFSHTSVHTTPPSISCSASASAATETSISPSSELTSLFTSFGFKHEAKEEVSDKEKEEKITLCTNVATEGLDKTKTAQFDANFADACLKNLSYSQLLTYLKKFFDKQSSSALEWAHENVHGTVEKDADLADIVSTYSLVRNYVKQTDKGGAVLPKAHETILGLTYLILLTRTALDITNFYLFEEIGADIALDYRIFESYTFFKNIATKKLKPIFNNIDYGTAVNNLGSWFSKRQIANFPNCLWVALFNPEGWVQGFDLDQTIRESIIKRFVNKTIQKKIRDFRIFFLKNFFTTLNKSKNWDEFFTATQINQEIVKDLKYNFNRLSQTELALLKKHAKKIAQEAAGDDEDEIEHF